MGGGLTKVHSCLLLSGGWSWRWEERGLKIIALGWVIEGCIIRRDGVQHSSLELVHWHTGSFGDMQRKSQDRLEWGTSFSLSFRAVGVRLAFPAPLSES